MTPTERQRFLRLLSQYRDAQTVYQKALDEHLRHLLPPPMLVTNKDLVDPLVSGMSQDATSNLYVPTVPTGEDPYPFFPQQGLPAAPVTSYRFKYTVLPPPSRSTFHTYVFRDPDVNPPPEEKFEVNLVEALVGWKAWSVKDNGLWSSSRPDCLWVPDRPFAARCQGQHGASVWDLAGEITKPPCDPVVTEEHTCGVYAADSRWNALEYAGQDPDNVLGQVYGWGRYVRGRDGWRAQWAYPKCFYLRPEQANLLETLQRYHVPIFVEQPTLIYNPEEDGYHEHRPEEADRDRGTVEGARPDEEDN